MTQKPTPDDALAELAKVAEARAKSGKGSVRLALSQDLEYLREAMRLGLTLSETAQQIEASKGLSISVAGLRKILLELLPTEYAEYLTNTGRGYRRTRAGVSLAKSQAAPTKSVSGPVEETGKRTTEKQSSNPIKKQADNGHATPSAVDDPVAFATQIFNSSNKGK